MSFWRIQSQETQSVNSMFFFSVLLLSWMSSYKNNIDTNFMF
jgi:hypothetical protein